MAYKSATQPGLRVAISLAKKLIRALKNNKHDNNYENPKVEVIIYEII